MFDNTQANREGWGLFSTDNDQGLVIQRLDEGPIGSGCEEGDGKPVFESDDEAFEFVKLMNFMGSGYHAKAVELAGG